jgi:predicted O-methyltransferase YrrM
VSDERWGQVADWISGHVVPEDDVLRDAVARADAAGIPGIQVDPAMGKFLNLVVRMTGAQRVLEVGTLAGYSTFWMARALPEDVRLFTLEYEPGHAAVASENIAAAGLTERVDVRVGDGAELLAQIAEAGEGPFDLVFIDADKESYDKYLAWALDLTRIGSVIIGDNVVRNGRTLFDPDTPMSQGMQRFVELLEADPRIDATVIQTVGDKSWDGFAIGIVTDSD